MRNAATVSVSFSESLGRAGLVPGGKGWTRMGWPSRNEALTSAPGRTVACCLANIPANVPC